jgi:hypothetical protein
MAKFTKAWEDYKSDYPNTKVEVVKDAKLFWTNTRKEKLCFIDETDGVRHYVYLTEQGYTTEIVPEEIWFL